MPSLDAYTLAVVSSLAALFLAVTMAGVYLAGNREPAIFRWALAGVMLSIGHLIGNIALSEPDWIDPRVAIALGNTAIMAGYCLLLLGIQQHLGHRMWIIPVTVCIALVFVAGLFWPAMFNDTVFRVSLLTVIYLVISFVAAALLWRAGDESLRPYRRAVAVVIVVNVVLLAARSIYIALGDGGEDSPAMMSVLVPVFLSSILFYMALNVSLALMLFRRKEVHLRFLARHDALTGLLNRYSLDEYAGRELARAERGEHDLSLVVLDLDNFKQVNDEHGHAAGDRVLAEAATRLLGVIREGDIAFRVGGEEFLILLPGAGSRRASQVGERLRLSLVKHPFEFQGREISVSTSVGVVSYDPLRDDWERMLRRADQALYRAKNAGRNRVEIACRPHPAGA